MSLNFSLDPEGYDFLDVSSDFLIRADAQVTAYLASSDAGAENSDPDREGVAFFEASLTAIGFFTISEGDLDELRRQQEQFEKTQEDVSQYSDPAAVIGKPMFPYIRTSLEERMVEMGLPKGVIPFWMDSEESYIPDIS